MSRIKVAVIGIGNCFSSLLQGIHYYRSNDARDIPGLMHADIGGFRPGDIEVVAAFDIDKRKVGTDIAEAVFALPNCAKVFFADIPKTGVTVGMGRIADGVSSHMEAADPSRTFLVSEAPEPEKEEVVRILTESKAEILLNYLPVGSEKATRWYVECALSAGLGVVNNIPVFVASDPDWANRFRKKNLPIIGDDIKSQMGATIVHRVLADLFDKRGVALKRTYQLNTGGNTDFLNMLNRDRLAFKKISKTEAVQASAGRRIPDENIHVGPSDYVPWQKDNKVCFIRMEGELFGGVPMELEMRLSVEDSPNSAGVAIDAIRCCKLALDRGIGGPLDAASAYFMKHPSVQYKDDVAYGMVEAFINESGGGR